VPSSKRAHESPDVIVRRFPMNDTTTTPEKIDPVKLTREHLEEVGKIWVGFAKTTLLPYVEKSKKWIDERKKSTLGKLEKSAS
jgi:hypothetical protein